MMMTNDGNETSNALKPADHARLLRWRQHLYEKRVTVPDVPDFRAFGQLSTLERLLRVLAIEAPNDCGPLRRAISDLKARKNARSTSRPCAANVVLSASTPLRQPILAWSRPSGAVATPLDGVRPAQAEPDLSRSGAESRAHA